MSTGESGEDTWVRLRFSQLLGIVGTVLAVWGVYWILFGPADSYYVQFGWLYLFGGLVLILVVGFIRPQWTANEAE